MCREDTAKGSRGDRGDKWDQILKGLGPIFHLERFKKGNKLSRFPLENSFWEQHGEWVGRGLRVEAGSLGRRRCNRQEMLGPERREWLWGWEKWADLK